MGGVSAARTPVAVIAGLAVAAAGGLAGARLATSGSPPAHTWTRAATTVNGPAAPAARWDGASVASLTLLRRVTAQEARLSVAGLSRCERRIAAAGRPATRVPRYRRCALRTLARTGASGMTNSRMLLRLVDQAEAAPRCDLLVRSLAGGTGILGSLAQSSLRDGVGAPWADVLAASRSIRTLARAALRLARRHEWQRACRARAAPRAAPQAL